MCDFTHLHCHTQYSLLDGASDIKKMLTKAADDNMPAVAITDHGNMFGAFKFAQVATDLGVKPILGCEVYVVEDRFQKSFVGGAKDKRYHQLLLAKNAKGYSNLSKLVSTGFIDGYYRSFPRVDRELIKRYSEGVIATSCCIGAEVPQTIIQKGAEAGEKVLLEWLDIFGEDYYIELQRHFIEDIDGSGLSQEDVNQILIGFAEKHNIKIIATNDSHYVEEQDWEAHDILLCLQTGSDVESENRFKFPNDQFYFKTQAEMKELFKDVPDAIENTLEIVEKVEHLNLKRDILLPHYKLPEQFSNQDDYLRHISYEGAKRRYGELDALTCERLDFELKIIKDMGFPGYFLIVQDFIKAARDMGVSVGPGRGSAAGSAVAFATGITNIDPIKYNLLFERFLNPERVSMPDIDIDFDDEGRQKVIDYVIDKYGKNQVAQIITYGTMAAKSSIRDVARVLKLPLQESDALAKMVPEGVGINLKTAFEENKELGDIRLDETSSRGKVLKMAESLEGSIRQRGIHAAGVIIAPDDITNYIPVCTAKDAELFVTQFDGKVIEDAGMLKMDFLGLKTLSIIRDAIKIVKRRHGIHIDPDEIPLDDLKTLELYQRGDTIGTFQFESDGMRMYLKELKPTNIEDLIAMNALYRPGPMDYIPDFIARKHGKEKVVYPHEWLEELLKPTYGIMVYQEQIMRCAQIMGGFSLGSADILRRAMGKKKKSEMDKQRIIFIAGAKEKGVSEEKAKEVFDIMEKFASYGFNRSHAAAYSVVAFQTAYLKANYPAEYMAAVLSHNMGDIKKVNFFLKECRRMKIQTLVPDVNESDVKFTVNSEGDIRFALSALKGMGESAVQSLVEERSENGNYKSIFDLTMRVNLRAINKRNVESLAQSGAFDSLGEANRAQYFIPNPQDNMNIVEKAVKFGSTYQQQQTNLTASLFGDALDDQMVEPKIPDGEEWSFYEKLKREKEITGIYISGHPLDDFELEMKLFAKGSIGNLEKYKGQRVYLPVIVASVNKRMDKRGRPFASVVFDDLENSIDVMLFSKDYTTFIPFLETGNRLLITALYQQRYNDELRFELKLQKIDFLADLVEERSKGIQIRLPMNQIDMPFVEKLDQTLNTHSGKKSVSFIIRNGSADSMINMYSKKCLVQIGKDLCDDLDNMNVKYEILR